jgi:hypothetical protein
MKEEKIGIQLPKEVAKYLEDYCNTYAHNENGEMEYYYTFPKGVFKLKDGVMISISVTELDKEFAKYMKSHAIMDILDEFWAVETAEFLIKDEQKRDK